MTFDPFHSLTSFKMCAFFVICFLFGILPCSSVVETLSRGDRKSVHFGGRLNIHRGQRVGAHRMHSIEIYIKPRNMDILETVLKNVSDPYHTQYGQYWTADEVAQLTSNDEGFDHVMNHLTSLGAIVRSWTKYKELITAEASIGTWESLFAAEFYEFHHKDFDHDGMVRALHYSMPKHLETHIGTVFHIADFPPVVNDNLVEHAVFHSASNVNALGTLVNGYVTPELLNQKYNIENNLGSAATRQAYFATLDQYVSPSDLTLFQSNMGLSVDGLDGNIGEAGHVSDSVCRNLTDCAESNLDVQYLMAVAQKVPTYQIYYTRVNYIGMLANITSSKSPPHVISISYAGYGYSEDYFNTFNNFAIKAGAMGITIVAGSGDDGAPNFGARGDSSKCGYEPSFPAYSPYVVAVGGTRGPETGAEEVACSSANGATITSGGGFAPFGSLPSYQSKDVRDYFSKVAGTSMAPKPGYALNSSSASTGAVGRGYPDLSILASRYLVYIFGNRYSLSGTSASAPVFAGMISLINSALLAKGKTPMGFINPFLYNQSNLYIADITSGSNFCTALSSKICCQEGFNATTGWDPVTGLGAPDFRKMLAAALAVKGATSAPTIAPTVAPSTQRPTIAPSLASTQYIAFSSKVTVTGLLQKVAFAAQHKNVFRNATAKVVNLPVGDITVSNYSYIGSIVKRQLLSTQAVYYTATVSIDFLVALPPSDGTTIVSAAAKLLYNNLTNTLTAAVGSGKYSQYIRSYAKLYQVTNTINDLAAVRSVANGNYSIVWQGSRVTGGENADVEQLLSTLSPLSNGALLGLWIGLVVVFALVQLLILNNDVAFVSSVSGNLLTAFCCSFISSPKDTSTQNIDSFYSKREYYTQLLMIPTFGDDDTNTNDKAKAKTVDGDEGKEGEGEGEAGFLGRLLTLTRSFSVDYSTSPTPINGTLATGLNDSRDTAVLYSVPLSPPPSSTDNSTSATFTGISKSFSKSIDHSQSTSPVRATLQRAESKDTTGYFSPRIGISRGISRSMSRSIDFTVSRSASTMLPSPNDRSVVFPRNYTNRRRQNKSLYFASIDDNDYLDAHQETEEADDEAEDIELEGSFSPEAARSLGSFDLEDDDEGNDDGLRGPLEIVTRDDYDDCNDAQPNPDFYMPIPSSSERLSAAPSRSTDNSSATTSSSQRPAPLVRTVSAATVLLTEEAEHRYHNQQIWKFLLLSLCLRSASMASIVVEMAYYLSSLQGNTLVLAILLFVGRFFPVVSLLRVLCEQLFLPKKIGKVTEKVSETVVEEKAVVLDRMGSGTMALKRTPTSEHGAPRSILIDREVSKTFSFDDGVRPESNRNAAVAAAVRSAAGTSIRKTVSFDDQRSVSAVTSIRNTFSGDTYTEEYSVPSSSTPSPTSAKSSNTSTREATNITESTAKTQHKGVGGGENTNNFDWWMTFHPFLALQLSNATLLWMFLLAFLDSTCCDLFAWKTVDRGHEPSGVVEHCFDDYTGYPTRKMKAFSLCSSLWAHGCQAVGTAYYLLAVLSPSSTSTALLQSDYNYLMLWIFLGIYLANAVAMLVEYRFIPPATISSNPPPSLSPPLPLPQPLPLPRSSSASTVSAVPMNRMYAAPIPVTRVRSNDTAVIGRSFSSGSYY